MLYFDRLIAEVRVDLHEPDINSPTDDNILQKAGDVVQLRHNEQNNTGVGWSVRSRDITTQPGQASYVMAENEVFGKPQRIHTVDPNNQFHVTGKIPIVERQDIEQYYDGSIRARLGSGYHTASCAVVYWQFGVPYVEFIPVPNGNATYRIWYETGEINEPNLGDNLPITSPFHRYVRVSTALACLAYCRWSRLLGEKPDAIEPERVLKIMQAYQAQLSPGLMKQELEYRAAFRDYIATAWQTGTGEPNPYGGGLDDFMYLGGW